MADALAKGKKPRPAPPKGGEDAFVEGAIRLWAWMGDNLRTVIVGLAAIAMVVLGALYYVNFQASVQEQAATELANLRLSAAAPELLIPDLESYIQRFEGTESAAEARLILARMYLDTGNAVEAARVAGAVEAAADVPVGFAARRLLATAQEAQGNLEAALATLRSLAEGARFDFQRRQVEAEAARVLVGLGQLGEAAATYERLAREAEEEDPAEAGEYWIRHGEVQAAMQDAS